MPTPGAEALRQTLEAFGRKAYAEAAEIAWRAVPPTLRAAIEPFESLAGVLRPGSDAPRDVIVDALEGVARATSDLCCVFHANAMCGQLERVRLATAAGQPAPEDDVTSRPVLLVLENIVAIGRAERAARTPGGAMMHYVDLATASAREVHATVNRCAELWQGCMQGTISPSVAYDFMTGAARFLQQRNITFRVAHVVMDWTFE